MRKDQEVRVELAKLEMPMQTELSNVRYSSLQTGERFRLEKTPGRHRLRDNILGQRIIGYQQNG